jgi:hypothetical protein
MLHTGHCYVRVGLLHAAAAARVALDLAILFLIFHVQRRLTETQSVFIKLDL